MAICTLNTAPLPSALTRNTPTLGVIVQVKSLVLFSVICIISFTSADTAEAIKSSSNSTATGPDGLTILHLKHAGPLAQDYLTELFNLSVAKATLPAVWKRAKSCQF